MKSRDRAAKLKSHDNLSDVNKSLTPTKRLLQPRPIGDNYNSLSNSMLVPATQTTSLDPRHRSSSQARTEKTMITLMSDQKPVQREGNVAILVRLKKKLHGSKSAQAAGSRRKGRQGNFDIGCSIPQEERISAMVGKNTPAPGNYDNFKTFFDRSKNRCFTIGKKLNLRSKAGELPGPANYDTRGNHFATQGGAGSSTGKYWTFGTEPRSINSDVVKRAESVPAPTAYSP